MIEPAEYKTSRSPTWCPGCGDFAVLSAIRNALYELQIPPKDTLVISGIGCSGNLSHYLGTYALHVVHGRALPVATGARLAKPNLNIMVVGGDGDGYGIGVGHFIHAMRRNLDITYIVMDNQIYGLTTGQASPTSRTGMVTKTTPDGVIEAPINPLALAAVSGATFIARGFSGDPKHLTELIKAGISHRGFAVIDVLSPCVTFNKVNTYDWFRSRVYKLEASSHDSMSFQAALPKSMEWGDRIPLGIIYRTQAPTYEELEYGSFDGPPARDPCDIAEELIEEFL